MAERSSATVEPASSPSALSYRLGDNGFGRVTIEARGSAALPLKLEHLRQLDVILAEVEREAAAERLQLLVIETAASHPSLTGYDLEEIRSARRPEAVAWSQEGQRVLRRLEQLPVPAVAVIRQDWLGGAAELALACSHRVMKAREPRIAFPQTRRGFLPAWGGTVRVPRLVGLPLALRLLLTDVELGAEEALQAGLIDAALPANGFDALLDVELREIAGTSSRRKRRSVRRRVFEDTAPGRRILVARAARTYREEARSNIAVRTVLNLVKETVSLPLEEAFALESAAAGALIETTEVQGRLHSERFTERAARRPPAGRTEFDGVAILGVGDTATDLAYALVSGGTPVRIKGSREGARSAVARTRDRIGWEQREGRISEAQAERRTSRLVAATGYGGFGVLEAVIAGPESGPGDIGELLRDAERHVRDECLLVFHDWTLSPATVEPALRRPERLLRITCVPPLERFSLIELQPGSATSPAALAAARRLARRLSLAPLVVRGVGPSPAARLLGTYLAEAANLLEEGWTVQEVDSAASRFGFEMPPFEHVDTIGGRRAHDLLERLAAACGERLRAPPLFARIAARGDFFYRYRGGRPAGPNPDLPAGQAHDVTDPAKHIGDRLVLALVNEAARILGDRTLTDVGQIEAISLAGLGFPRDRGGLLYHAQNLRLPAVVAELERAAEEVGPRYEPAAYLRELVDRQRGFFPPGSAPRGTVDVSATAKSADTASPAGQRGEQMLP